MPADPQFEEFAQALEREAAWSATIHPDPTSPDDGGQSVSDQEDLLRLAAEVRRVGQRLGYI